MTNEHHIVKSYDDELTQLKDSIIRMGGIAEQQIENAVQALTRRDSKLAETVIANDDRLDGLERDVDQLCVRLLALRQPMARDLREIIAALKISSDLERIGDYASNIAKRSVGLNQTAAVEPAGSVPRLARRVQQMIKDVLDAYVARDADAAVAVWRSDDEVDEIYNNLFRALLTYMMEDPRNITPCTHLLFMIKNLERIGDHATNVAENIFYLVKGEPLKGARPKGGGGEVPDIGDLAPRTRD